MKLSVIPIIFSILMSPVLMFANESCGDEKTCCSAPKVVKYVQPELPADLLKPGDSARIVVRCAIDETGKLVGARTVSASRKDVEAIVLDALKSWEFEAAKHEGEAQRSTINIPFSFTVAAK